MEQVDNFDLESKTKWCVGSNPTSPTITSRVAVGGRFASVKWILKVSTTTGMETKYYSLNMKKENTMICRFLQTLNKKQSKTFRALTLEGCWFQTRTTSK